MCYMVAHERAITVVTGELDVANGLLGGTWRSRLCLDSISRWD